MTNPYPFPPVLDSSMLATFKQCPQLFYKTYIANWKPRDQSVHLHAGGAFAKGMEVARNAYYTGLYEQGIYLDQGSPATETTSAIPPQKGWKYEQLTPFDAENSIACGLAALMFAYGDFQHPADSAKSLDRMAGAFEFYFENYPLTETDYVPIILPSGKRGIEFSFVEPLPVTHPESGDPLLYSGRMDALLGYAGGNFITDEKTTTQLGASWSRQWDLRSQFTGYSWGCARHGIKVDGVIVRGVSILKTKYDTQQAISYRAEWLVNTWLDDLVGPHGWIEDMIRCWTTGKWKHNYDHACGDFGGCNFRLACSTKPEDEINWMKDYFERRHWDPVTRKETLL